jgi:hypothetical protein
VTDAKGRVVSFNNTNSFTTIVSSVNTGTNVLRADELAYDPADGVLLVINNADTPPFGTLITVNKTNCALTLGTKITFNAANGVNATNGAEQPVWEPRTRKFYLAIPEVDGDGSGTFFKGAVAQIDPKSTGAVDGLFQINFMQPAGLTVGPNGDLLVGSNSVFDLAGKKCTAVVATASTPARIVPPICGTTAGPEVAICNPGRGCTPSNGSLVAVQGVGGGDEVWFNSGDGNYYVTAGNFPAGPVLGVVKSVTNTLSQLVPTLYAQQAVGIVGGTPSFVHSSGTVHSVAASAANNHVYVPLPANTAYPNCLQGCIAVYGVVP